MGVEVDAQATWCQRHRTLLHLDPKRRFDLASVRLFDFAVRDRRIMIECGFTGQAGSADVDKLTDVLAAHSPLCCFVSGADLAKVFKEAYPGDFERAQIAMINHERFVAEYGGSSETAARPVRPN